MEAIQAPQARQVSRGAGVTIVVIDIGVQGELVPEARRAGAWVDSADDPIKARFFQRVSDGVWLQRLDTQSLLSSAEAEMHGAAEYGFPVRTVDVILPYAQFETLAAQRRVRAVSPPAQPPTPLTPEQRAWAAATPVQRIEMLAKKAGFMP